MRLQGKILSKFIQCAWRHVFIIKKKLFEGVHSNWIYNGIRSTGLSGIRSTVEPSGLISMVHSGSISMLEMTGRSQSTLYYRVDIVLLCVKSR